MLNPPNLGQRVAFGLGALVCAVVALIPWWRNHAVLRDFYDYGLVIAAAGRINLGERPYVDFTTPIQTLQLGTAAWAERLMGARYLSLTYANGIFIVLSVLVLSVVLARRLGAWTALLVSAAVVVASSGQHTIMWHNAMGVTLLAGVVWTTATLPPTVEARRWSWVFVAILLWLGGMTKLTYQVAALAFAMLFVFRATWRGAISRREGSLGLILCLFCGMVFPVTTELLYTGANFGQWVHNVIQLAGSRTELLGQIATLRFYWQTPHDYYAPMYFPFVGAWGLAALGLVAMAVIEQRRRDPKSNVSENLFLGLGVFGAVACGGTFLATNFDIAYLSGAAWLALATAVAMAFLPVEAGKAHQRVRALLGIFSLSLLVPAWLSAWQGARSLWGVGPLVRSELVSADDLPARYDYLRGLAIPSPLRASLHAFDEYVGGLAARGVSPGAYYFANGTEWMVRAFPAARHRGLPLWLHHGTTFSNDDVWLITDRLDRGTEMQVVISDNRWDRWFYGMGAFLEERYEKSALGPELALYRLRSDLRDVLGHPLDFSAAVKSNLLSNGLTVTGGPLAFRVRPGGGFLSGTESYRLDLGFSIPDLAGEFVAELLPSGADRQIDAAFRITERGAASRPDRVVLEEKVTLSAAHHAIVRPFSVGGLSGELALEIVLPPGQAVVAGWRTLRTSGAGVTDPSSPAPLDRTLARQRPTLAWQRALFAEDQPAVPGLSGFSIAIEPEQRAHGPELFTHAPAEAWFRVDGAAVHVTGEFGLREPSWTHSDSLLGVTVAVVYSKGGRFEVLDRRELRPRVEADRVPQTFDVVTPEPGGWVGLVVTTLGGSTNAYGHLWWRGLRVK